MDPLSIAVSSVRLVSECSKLSGYISWLTDKVPDVDDIIRVLYVEIDSLSKVSGSIGASFSDPALVSLGLALQTGYEAQHWQNARDAMDDCKDTLGKMHEILQRVSKVKRRGIFQKSANVLELYDSSAKAIEILRLQIAAYRKAMEISLQLVYMFAPPNLSFNRHSAHMLANGNSNSLLPSKLYQLSLDIHQLLSIFPERNMGHDTMTNLEQCVRSAERVVSTATRTLDMRWASGSQGGSNSDELSERMMRTNINWGSPAPSVANSERGHLADTTVRSSTDISAEIVRRGSSNRSLSVKSSSIKGFCDKGDGLSDISMVSSNRASNKSMEDKATFDETIQLWLSSGSDKFACNDYAKAAFILSKVMSHSEVKYGTQFAWRDETLKMLLVSYCKLGKWAEGKRILEEDFDGKEVTIGELATSLCQARKWDYIVQFMPYEFDGRESILEKVSRAYVLDKKWNEAKVVLLELLKYRMQESKRGLERMYMLADVCWTIGDWQSTRHWCVEGLEGPNTILSKRDPLYSQFLKLIVLVCEAQQDTVETQRYKSLISFDVNDSAQIEEMCLMRPKNAASRVIEYFKDIMGTNKQRDSIRANILKSGKGILGSGRGWAIIHALAANGRDIAVGLLVDKGTDVDARDEEGNTPMSCAVSCGHASTVRVLLEKGASYDIKNKLGNTPLMSATLKGSEAIVKVLLDHGANIETIDADQNTILMSAVMDKLEGIVRLLIERGANLEAKNKAGRTALMIASLIADEEMATILIKQGADIEAKDNDGNTSLMLAAGKENTQLVELLLENGADLNVRNNNGSTALALAKRNGVYRTQVVRRLINTQARDKVIGVKTSLPSIHTGPLRSA